MKETLAEHRLVGHMPAEDTMSEYTMSEYTFQGQGRSEISLAASSQHWTGSEPDLKDQRARQSAEYSIRIPSTLESLACDKCLRRFRAAGPTGFFGNRPICDGCLLIGDRQLGMAMTMITVCRYYGGMKPIDDVEEQLHQRELAAFARIYEGFAARYGPARPWSNFFADGIPEA